jgi:hypothetical protein
MDRDAFEQLISEWLDARHDLALRAHLDAAIQTDPGLAVVLAEWQTLDRLVRSGVPTPRGVDWARFQKVLSAGIDAAGDPDAALDAALGRSPTIERAIDWTRMKDRISAAVDADAAARRRAHTRRLWLGGTAGAALTAAAALILALLPNAGRTISPAPDTAIAQAEIAAPVAMPTGGIAIVSITGGEAPAAPQVLFMIDPPRPPLDESAAGYF